MQDNTTDIISIHAPREGSDQNSNARAILDAIFLSTLPARGATADLAMYQPE